MYATWRWITGHVDAPRCNLPPMDLSTVDPERRYNLAALSDLTGLKRATITSYVSRNQWPKPHYDPTAPDRPYWFGQQIIDFYPTRPGRGNPGKPKPRGRKAKS